VANPNLYNITSTELGRGAGLPASGSLGQLVGGITNKLRVLTSLTLTNTTGDSKGFWMWAAVNSASTKYSILNIMVPAHTSLTPITKDNPIYVLEGFSIWTGYGTGGISFIYSVEDYS
jgi:hypothetical protein